MDDLPDLYACVACDVIRSCGRKDGLWVDLGCGSGSLALALAAISSARLLLVDPDPEALAAAMERAEELGLSDRTSAIVGAAERIPMKAGSADLVVSRGSISFWDDRPAGLREVYRILRPGGKAMIGGGLGSGYPLCARE